MIQKIVSNIALGFKGILTNKHLKKNQKFFLLIDYFKLIGQLFLVYFFGKKISVIKINSFKYTIYFENYITFFYIFNEIFCKEVYNPFLIKNYYDLGANIGLSVLWYKFFNPSLDIHSFEPNPKIYKYLIKNIKRNHLTNVFTYSVALSDKKGTSKFYAIKDNIQCLDSGLVLNQKLPYKSFDVKTEKLSGYINKKIDLLKIDIEGGEYKVFKDLFATKKIKYIKKIIFEAHFFNQQEKEILKKLIIKLQKIGYIKQLENSSYTKVYSFYSNK